MQYHPRHIILLSQEARRPRPNRPPIQYNPIMANIQILRQIQINSLNIVIEWLLRGDLPIRLTKASIFVYYRIHMNVLKEVTFEPSLDQINVFGIAVWKYHGVLGIFVYEEDLEFGARLGVEEEVVGVHWESRYWGLKEHLWN